MIRLSRCFRRSQSGITRSSKIKEGIAVVWLSDVAKLVGNDVIDGVNRGLDEASFQQETVRGRH